MRQLLPEAVDAVDPWDVYRPADRDAPLLRLNMVTSLDGAATDAEGRSGGLGGDGDWEVFRTLRAQADAIVVGAGTARTEGYGPHRVPAHLRQRRRGLLGAEAPASIVLVSRSLALDPASALFTEAQTPTTVLTCAASDPERRRALGRVGEVLVAGEHQVDLAEGLAQVRERHGPIVVGEGGPSLNRLMLAEAVVDQLCVTVAPQLLGSAGPRLGGQLETLVQLALRSACTDDSGELFLSYAVTDPAEADQNSRSSSEARPRSAS